MTIDERRAALRAAQQLTGPDATAILEALDGATEDERLILRKTLPPTRLLKAEGATPRAVAALAGLGPGVGLSEALWPYRHELGQDGDVYRAVLSAAVRSRDDAWIVVFIDGIESLTWSHRGWARPLQRALVAERDLTPASAQYVGGIITHGSRDDKNALRDAAGIAAFLRSDHRLLSHDIDRFFDVPGIGHDWRLLDESTAGAWEQALASLASDDAELRERLLDLSLDALLRDLPARDVTWYPRVHRALAPTPAEIAQREARYLQVLMTQPSVAVGLAQDMIDPSSISDVDGLFEASRVVLSRTEKKLRKSQLQLLRALVRSRPEHAEAVASIAAEVRDSLPADLAVIAAELSPEDAAIVAAETAPERLVTVAAPTLSSRPRGGEPPAVADVEELRALLADWLEGAADGASLQRTLDAVLRFAPSSEAGALAARAREVLGVDDRFALSLRRHVAALILVWLRQPVARPRFRGFGRHMSFSMDQEVPPDIDVEEWTATSSTFVDGVERVIEVSRGRSGYRYTATAAPFALALGSVAAATDRLQGRSDALVIAPLPPLQRAWERRVVAPGGGIYAFRGVNADRRVVWVAPAPADDVTAVRDVEPLAAEYLWHVEIAREADVLGPSVEWAAWLLRDDLDTFAAHMHPMLSTATEFVNVRGVAEVLAALGDAHAPLGAPGHSALALGLSAKTADHRASAAEALASLADTGLLDVEAFAAELSAHLREGFVLAGRAAQTLADATSISALAGYRVLQVLDAALPSIEGVIGLGKLVELAATLSAAYGTPITVPAYLAAKRGSSALVVAVRALQAQRPAATELVESAASAAG